MAEPVRTVRASPRRSQPQPRPASDEPLPRPTVIPGMGQMPFKPGVFLLPEEVARLKKLGWKEGDAIPPNLAEALKAEQEAVRREVAESLPVPEDTPPTVPPPGVDIDSLPPERQKALREFMAGYAEMARRSASGEEGLLPSMVPMTANPSVNQAMQIAAQKSGKVQVTDSGVRQDSVVIGGQPPSAKPKTDDRAESKAAELPEPLAGGSLPMQNCPRCDYRLTEPYELKIEAADKMVFLQALMGRKRFKKAFDLFGGHVKVTLKSLSVNEDELCLSQVAYDQRDGKVPNFDVAAMLLMDYRLAVALDSYKVGDEFLELPETLDGWEVEGNGVGKGPPQTKLPAIVKWLHEESPLGANASLWRQVGRLSLLFHKLTDHLESRSRDADFWKAIGGAA